MQLNLAKHCREHLSHFPDAWDRFWFSRCNPVTAARFRIALGAMLFLSYLAMGPNWDRFFAADGILSLGDPAVPERGLNSGGLFDIGLPEGFWWWTVVVLSLAFMAGAGTRYAAIGLFLLQWSLIRRNPMIVNGEELVFRMALFYSCFAPLSVCHSVDAWIRRERGKLPPLPSIWPVRLLQINTACIYLFSQIAKLRDDGAWRNGDALYYTMVSGVWSRWPWPEWFYYRWASAGATWLSLGIELAFPFVVWIGGLRLPAVLLLVTLHLVIALSLQNVTFFSLSMVVMLLLFVE